MRDEITKESIGFVDSYYFHEFLKSYSDYMENTLNKSVLGTVFNGMTTVSYTHLDVYKRQMQGGMGDGKYKYE